MVNIKKILEEKGKVSKFAGNAPDGFILVHENTLEQLKDLDIWLGWKMDKISIEELNKINFENN